MFEKKLALRNLTVLVLALAFCMPVQAWAEKSKHAGEAEEYLIGKGDVLEINVWKEEELTRTLKVRVDGKISLPLLDDVQAAGRSPMELKSTVEKKLSEYIEGPEVTVIVQNQSGQFYLIGEVAGTGAYPLQKDLTIIQALALAGGFTEWADKDRILLLRRCDGKVKRMNINYDDIVSGDAPEQNVLIQSEDTVIIR